MTCFDVYTLSAPAGCGNLWVYPSQVHPTPPPSGHGWGISPYQKRRPDDDVEAIALALLLLN